MNKKYSDIYDASYKLAKALKSVNVIVDLGARHGEGYDRLGQYFPDAKYIFVEPSPRCIPNILEKMKKLDDKVRLVQAALGDSDYKTDFFILESDDDQSGNMYTDRNGTYGNSSLTKIDVCNYRNFVSEVGHIDFLKCNIEGGEYELIETSFFDSVTAFVMEAHNKHIKDKTYIDVVRKLGDMFDLEIWGDVNYKYCFINGIKKV